VDSGKTEKVVDVGVFDQFRLSPSGTRLAFEAFPNLAGASRITIWNVATGKVGASCNGPSLGRGFHAMDFSADEKLLAAGCWSDTFRVFDVASGKPLLDRTCQDTKVVSLVFSPDSRQVATGMEDGTVLLWDVSEAVTK
jgi:WD40 repeat protein